jgi:hypothetical protein
MVYTMIARIFVQARNRLRHSTVITATPKSTPYEVALIPTAHGGVPDSTEDGRHRNKLHAHTQHVIALCMGHELGAKGRALASAASSPSPRQVDPGTARDPQSHSEYEPDASNVPTAFFVDSQPDSTTSLHYISF